MRLWNQETDKHKFWPENLQKEFPTEKLSSLIRGMVTPDLRSINVTAVSH